MEWMETLDSNLEKQVQVALLEYVGDDVVQLCSDARVLALFKEVKPLIFFSNDMAHAVLEAFKMYLSKHRLKIKFHETKEV